MQPEHDLIRFETLLQARVKPLVVGGQAVNLWAKACLSQVDELREFEPFLSKDCDLVGDSETLMILARETGWE